MRILIIGINFYPELTGIGKYTGEMVEWLSEKDCEVKIITAPPYYPDWKISNNYKKVKYYREFSHNFSVIRCPIWVPSRPTGFKRILHLGSFAISSFLPSLWLAIFWRPRIIMVIEPPILCAPAALISSFLAKATSWLHVQDFEVDAAFELGIIRARWSKLILSSVERRLMRRFGLVSTISDRMVKRLNSKGVDEARTFLFPNWVDTELVYPLDRPSVIRQELGIPDSSIVLLYSGNMGKKQGLEIIIDAAKQLQNAPEFVFLLCGQGAVRIELKKMAEGMRNVLFMDLQPLDRLNELLNSADIHMLPQRADAEDLVMPSKLTAMMASGKPIIATARQESEIAKVLVDGGLVVPPGDLNSFVAAICRLRNDRLEREKMGKNARNYAVLHWGKEQVLTQVFSEKLKFGNKNQ